MRRAFQNNPWAAGERMLRAAWRRVENIFEHALPSQRETPGFSEFRDALDQSLQPIAFSDSLGSFRFGNRAFRELFGFDQHQQVYRRWLFEFLAHPELSGEILSALRASGIWRGRIQARRQDSSPLAVEITAYAIGGERSQLDWAHWYFFTPAKRPVEGSMPGESPATGWPDAASHTSSTTKE